MPSSFMASVLTNLFRSAYGDPKKGIEKSTPLDFFPGLEEPGQKGQVRKQSPEQMKEILLGIAAAQNRRVAKREKL